MSIHDETWDKCPKCKQTIKTWHSDYHNGYCLKYSYDEYINLMNEYPAREYTPEEKRRIVLTQYQPESRIIRKDFIYAAISALKAGLEYAQECLIRHDENLGRTISRNKREAEYMEEDIRKIQAAIENLKK